MGIVVPLWIWLPVVLWVMWRYERGKRERLEMRWIVGSEERREVLSSREPQLLLEEIVKRGRRKRTEGGGVMEMRSMMIVAVFGLLSAILYAREPGPAVVVAEGGAASPVATSQVWPVQTNPPVAPWHGPLPSAGTTATNLPQSNVPVPPIPPNPSELSGPANVNNRLSPPPQTR